MRYTRIIFVGLICLMAVCKPRDKQKVSLRLIAPDFKNTRVLLYTLGVVDSEMDTLGNVQLDSLGNGTLQLEIEKPVFASLLVDRRWGEIYVQPGYDMSVVIPQVDTLPLTFSGTGKAINNYLATADAIKKRIEQRNGYTFMQLPEPVAFQELVRQTIDSLQVFHAGYVDTVTLSPADEHLVRSRSAVNLFFAYEIYRYTYSAMNPQARFDAQLPLEIPELPDGKHIPLDSTLVSHQLASYGGAVQIYFFNTYFQELDKDSLFRSNPQMQALRPMLINGMIKRDKHPPALQELLLAKNLDFNLAMMGITPALDSAYESFKKEYPSSQWRSVVEKRYNKWALLQPGNSAPDFSGVTVSGDTVHLSAFKGKLVFIDVWATWCGPCVAEIPASKKLRQKFENNNNLVFLNFSIDQDAERWKNKVLADPDWKDVQLLESNTAWEKTVKAKYMIWGIPRYMLIDADGQIITVNAARPSDPELEKTLSDLLEAI